MALPVVVLIAAANQCDPSMLCLDFILHRKPVRAVAPKSLARRTIHDQLLRALEKHFPYTVEALEGSFELILGEFARQALKTYRCSKRAIFQDGPVDVWCIALKPCLACHNPAFNAQRNPRWPASPAG
jgi:hypothetical protein